MGEWWCDGAKGVLPKLKPQDVHLEAQNDKFSYCCGRTKKGLIQENDVSQEGFPTF